MDAGKQTWSPLQEQQELVTVELLTAQLYHLDFSQSLLGGVTLMWIQRTAGSTSVPARLKGPYGTKRTGSVQETWDTLTPEYWQRKAGRKSPRQVGEGWDKEGLQCH